MEKIKVVITYARKVDYRREVELPIDQYELVKDLIGDDISPSENREAYYLLDSIMDAYDITGADDELLDVTVDKK